MSDSRIHEEEPHGSSDDDCKKSLEDKPTNGVHYPQVSPQPSSADIDEISNDLFDMLFDVGTLDEVFCEHREASIMARFGGHQMYSQHYPSTSNSGEQGPSSLVTGSRKQYEVECHACHRSIAATRYAPHLDKCIGMGRNSSRVAHRKLQQAQEGHSSNSHSEDELLAASDDDVDWQTKRKKRKRGRQKTGNGAGGGSKRNRNGAASLSIPTIAPGKQLTPLNSHFSTEDDHI